VISATLPSKGFSVCMPKLPKATFLHDAPSHYQKLSLAKQPREKNGSNAKRN
jgi:hypothetical protein